MVDTRDGAASGTVTRLGPSAADPAARRGRGATANPTGRYESARREAFHDGTWTADPPAPLRTQVTPERSARIIARNGSPDIPFDRSINPYRGCEHGCIYCYARPTHAWLGLSPGLDFESRIFTKPDAARLLAREIAAPGYRPETIALGTATASYQVEGAHDEDGKGPSIWDEFTERPGVIADGSSGRDACDSYHRLGDDLDLISGLGVEWYRFSLAWPRIVPQGVGRVEPRGLDYYDRLVDGLLERGVKPLPTLYHWDLPLALQETGGWLDRRTPEAFAD